MSQVLASLRTCHNKLGAIGIEKSSRNERTVLNWVLSSKTLVLSRSAVVSTELLHPLGLSPAHIR
ncbi:hypothetical protein GCM10008090_04840 [Arenicella chitinivorans]|uniref:Uncharacterized protein n=1 Tax=Arenicella chitinivorans TaxID=1329800 RepID=A0A918VI40_9GAMM|nr:hypothetical protein GCM10008090_04840 [Arenicella chitinivorans]